MFTAIVIFLQTGDHSLDQTAMSIRNKIQKASSLINLSEKKNVYDDVHTCNWTLGLLERVKSGFHIIQLLFLVVLRLIAVVAL